MDMFAFMVLYLDEASGLPQIGLILPNPENPAEAAYVPNERIEDILDIVPNLHVLGTCRFAGGFPQSLAN